MQRSKPAAEIREALEAARERNLRHIAVGFDQGATDLPDAHFVDERHEPFSGNFAEITAERGRVHGHAARSLGERDAPIGILEDIPADRIDPPFGIHFGPENVSIGTEQAGMSQRICTAVEKLQQGECPGHSFLRAKFLKRRGQFGPGFRRK